MKRMIVVMGLLALAGIGAAFAYQAAARQRDYSALLTRGDEALRDDQTFAAIEAYSGAIYLRPNSMLAYLRRGQTYRRLGDREDLDAATRDFRTAAALDPAATRPLEELGDIQYQLQRYDRAAESYERRLKLDERSASVFHKLALASYRDGNVDGALTAVTQAVRLDDEIADVHYLLGLCLRDKGRTAEASRAFEKAVAIAPGMIPAREELADVYASAGRHGDELEQLQVLAGLDRDHVERHVAIGLAHARAGHWDLAVLTLGAALERNPDDPLIYRALGQIWLERPRDDRAFLSKAREALERVASSPTASSNVLTLYARALLEEGDADGAEHALLQATTHFPVEPAAFLFYAATAEKQNHLESARSALIRYGSLIPAVQNDAEFVPRATRIAMLSLRLNDPVTAADWWMQAASASPNDARLLASLADAQASRGDAAAAQATIARGLEKEPGNAQLLALGRRLRLRR